MSQKNTNEQQGTYQLWILYSQYIPTSTCIVSMQTNLSGFS